MRTVIPKGLCILLLAGSMLTGCEFVRDVIPMSDLSVAQVKEQAAKLNGQVRRVMGVVQDSAKVPFITSSYYIISSDGEDIPVVTSGSLPEVGRKVRIKATVVNVIVIKGISVGVYLDEIKKLSAYDMF